MNSRGYLQRLLPFLVLSGTNLSAWKSWAAPVAPVTAEDRPAAFPELHHDMHHSGGVQQLVMVDQIEYRHEALHPSGGADAHGWIGTDARRLWLSLDVRDNDHEDLTGWFKAHYGRSVSAWWELLRRLMSRLLVATACVVASHGWTHAAPLEEHVLPAENIDLLDRMHITSVDSEQTLIEVARQHGIGQEEIRNANPMVDRWRPRLGSRVIIIGQRLLPTRQREGIVINLPEFRLYYFPKPASGAAHATVITVPISVGRMDWKTPLGQTRIVSKQKDPSWTPPESIRAEHAADGEILPKVVPPGPDNPLGGYALRLGIPGYLIHGTDKEFGVGMQVTHGCMRLLPEHVEALFGMVSPGTSVRLMNQPIKLGWGEKGLYLEVHPALEEEGYDLETELVQTRERIDQELAAWPELALDESQLATSLIEKTGLPVLISRPVPGFGG